MILRIFRLLARLPLSWLQGTGAALGWLVYRLSGEYRRKMASNLIQAGYDDPAFHLRAAVEAGRMVGELPWVWFRPAAQVTAQVRCDDVAVFEAAEKAGRGVLFLTPHLGCFEVIARFYASRAPVTVMFKPPRKDLLSPVMVAARNGAGLHAAPASQSGIRQLLRALRRGEAVGLLPDQVPTDGLGLWAPFFGRPAYTMTLPQRLADTTGAVVVMTVGERLPRGQGWRMHARILDESPTPEVVNREMAAMIRQWPHQYLWAYNRYKQPPGVDAP